jgi:hypothetical protein
MTSEQLGAFFGYPGGKVFALAAELQRHVNGTYARDIQPMINSGLSALTRASLLISHQEVEFELAEPAVAFRISLRVQIPFGTFAFERPYASSKPASTSGNEPPGRRPQSVVCRKP